MKIKVRLTKRMMSDFAKCHEMPNCQGCSCEMGDGRCIFNYTGKIDFIRASNKANKKYRKEN